MLGEHYYFIVEFDVIVTLARSVTMERENVNIHAFIIVNNIDWLFFIRFEYGFQYSFSVYLRQAVLNCVMIS